jgi:hypothetical protein
LLKARPAGITSTIGTLRSKDCMARHRYSPSAQIKQSKPTGNMKRLRNGRLPDDVFAVVRGALAAEKVDAKGIPWSRFAGVDAGKRYAHCRVPSFIGLIDARH